LDGTPTVLVDNGKLLRERMDKVRVDEGDITEAARKLQGLESLEQVKYAILEKTEASRLFQRIKHGQSK
jgi:uncharacterized membrane protein YcaP (DUF421 family)